MFIVCIIQWLLNLTSPQETMKALESILQLLQLFNSMWRWDRRGLKCMYSEKDVMETSQNLKGHTYYYQMIGSTTGLIVVCSDWSFVLGFSQCLHAYENLLKHMQLGLWLSNLSDRHCADFFGMLPGLGRCGAKTGWNDSWMTLACCIGCLDTAGGRISEDTLSQGGSAVSEFNMTFCFFSLVFCPKQDNIEWYQIVCAFERVVMF